MKKIIILGLVLLMVVIFATTVFAKAQKFDLIEGSSLIQEDLDGESVGFVILNNPNPEDEDDECNLVVVVSLKDGVPSTLHYIYLNHWIDGSRKYWYTIGTLTTNKFGNANVELRLKTQDISVNLTPGDTTLSVNVDTDCAFPSFIGARVDIFIKE